MVIQEYLTVSNPTEIVLTKSYTINPQYIIIEIVDILNSYLKIKNDFSKYLRGDVRTIMIDISLSKKIPCQTALGRRLFIG